MSLEIKIPAVGESISEVTISQWLKKEGEKVEMDEIIAELESDKATFELNAEAEGVLHTKVEEGTTVEVGEVIGNIDTESVPEQKQESASNKEEVQSSSGDQASQPAPREAEGGGTSGGEKTGKVVEMPIPAVGESITEVTISQWFKSNGDMVEQDEVIAEIESDKATFELTAQTNGKLSIKVDEGSTVEVGTVACTIEEMEVSGSRAQPETSQQEGGITGDGQQEPPAEEGYAAHHASPAAAKILSEKGIDPNKVKGTGKDGRITKEDAEQATVSSQEKPAKPQTTEKSTDGQEKQGEPGAKYETGEAHRKQRREKMSNLRKTVSKRLVSVKNETAMLTTFNEVNMKPVMDIRKKYKDSFKEKFDVNLGFMSFFTKAACMALQEWPAVNAMIDGDEIIYSEYCDVSIAVSSPKGLVVPVIRNAEGMSFEEIEKEVVKLAKKARDNKLSIDEMSGGTFTITNGGIFGSMLSTPIINSPQSAILGMHNIVERPVVENGEIVVRPIMYLALSYDHRIIDGRQAVSSLYRIKELVEDPTRLLLGV